MGIFKLQCPSLRSILNSLAGISIVDVVDAWLEAGISTVDVVDAWLEAGISTVDVANVWLENGISITDVADAWLEAGISIVDEANLITALCPIKKYRNVLIIIKLRII